MFLELKRNNAEDSYSKVNGFIDSWNYMLTGISSISVGYIYTLNQKSPFVICIVFCSIRSLLMRGIQIVLLPGVGYMIEHFGLNHALVVLTGIITLLFVALRLLFLRLKPTDSV